MLSILSSVLWIFLIYLFIAALWTLAESLFYGKITPRRIDDVVAIILAISLYFNIR
jgi:TM2 domain-containing membrane protein YozV